MISGCNILMIFLRINLPNFVLALQLLGGGLEPSGLWEFTPMFQAATD